MSGAPGSDRRLVFDQSCGERRREHSTFQLRPNGGQRADVILMRMRDHDRQKIASELFDAGEVGQTISTPGRSGPGKPRPQSTKSIYARAAVRSRKARRSSRSRPVPERREHQVSRPASIDANPACRRRDAREYVARVDTVSPRRMRRQDRRLRRSSRSALQSPRPARGAHHALPKPAAASSHLALFAQNPGLRTIAAASRKNNSKAPQIASAPKAPAFSDASAAAG